MVVVVVVGTMVVVGVVSSAAPPPLTSSTVPTAGRVASSSPPFFFLVAAAVAASSRFDRLCSSSCPASFCFSLFPCPAAGRVTSTCSTFFASAPAPALAAPSSYAHSHPLLQPSSLWYGGCIECVSAHISSHCSAVPLLWALKAHPCSHPPRFDVSSPSMPGNSPHFFAHRNWLDVALTIAGVAVVVAFAVAASSRFDRLCSSSCPASFCFSLFPCPAAGSTCSTCFAAAPVSYANAHPCLQPSIASLGNFFLSW